MAKKKPAKNADEKTKVDQIIDRIKSHRILAWVVVAGVALTALDPVLNVLDRIRSGLSADHKSETVGEPQLGAVDDKKARVVGEQKPGPVGNPQDKVSADAAADPRVTSAPVSQTTGANLALVGVDLTSEERLAHHHDVVLDIRLRNSGNEVAFVNKAIVRFERIGHLRPLDQEIWNAAAQVEATHNYSMTFTPKCVPYAATITVSQAIRPNDVDRFLLTLTTDFSLDHDETVYVARLELIYNEDSRRVQSQKLLMILPELPDVFAYRPSTDSPYQPRDQAVRAALNLETAMRLSNVGGQMTPYLKRVLDEIRSAPVDNSVTADERKQELTQKRVEIVQRLSGPTAPCS